MSQKLRTLFIIFITAIVLTAPVSAQSLKDIYATGSALFVAEMTIDESSLPKGELFESIVDIAIDGDGNIYLCDIGACNIKKFSEEGKFVKVIGRKGQGPGEFSLPSGIVITRKCLIIYDIGNRRLCSLTTDGEYVKSIGIRSSEGVPRNMRAHPMGDVFIEGEINHYREPDKPQDCVIQIFSQELELKKTLFTHKVLRNKFRTIKGIFFNIIQPFSPDVYWSVAPDGKIIIGIAEDYTIAVHDAGKGLLSSFKHSYKPVKVTDQDKEKFFSGLTYSTSGGGRTGVPEEIKKMTEFPRTKPAFDGLFVDYEGNILVHAVRKDTPGSTPECDAFDLEGTFIGTVKMEGIKSFPHRVIIEKRCLWILVWDEDGRARAVKYHIAPVK